MLTVLAFVAGLLCAIVITNGLRVCVNFYASNLGRIGVLTNQKAYLTLKEIKAAQECAEWLHLNKNDVISYSVSRDLTKPCNQSNSHAELVMSEN